MMGKYSLSFRKFINDREKKIVYNYSDGKKRSYKQRREVN